MYYVCIPGTEIPEFPHITELDAAIDLACKFSDEWNCALFVCDQDADSILHVVVPGE